MDWEHLQCGGVLLPDLVEFYQWLHTNLSHIITINHAGTITIGRVIELAKKNSTEEYAKYLDNLYKRVKKLYNEYVKMIGGVGSKEGASNYQNHKIFTIKDDVPLLYLLSGQHLPFSLWF